MDTLAFLIALGVGVAVVLWYAVNEAKGGDGALGLFALRGETSGDGETAQRARYRPRTRLRPESRAGVPGPGAQKAYRDKPRDEPSWRAAGDEGPGESEG